MLLGLRINCKTRVVFSETVLAKQALNDLFDNYVLYYFIFTQLLFTLHATTNS